MKNAIVIRRNKGDKEATIDIITLSAKNYFQEMQDICGGIIQLFGSYKGERNQKGSNASLDVWVGEEAAMYDLPRTVSAIHPQQFVQELYGPVVIMASKKAYGSPRELTVREASSIQLKYLIESTSDPYIPLLTISDPNIPAAT